MATKTQMYDMARTWLNYKLFGGEGTVDARVLERDGRSRPKVMRALVAEGYLTATDNKNVYGVTSKAWAEWASEPVDFAADTAGDPWQEFDEVPLKQQKWLLENVASLEWGSRVCGKAVLPLTADSVDSLREAFRARCGESGHVAPVLMVTSAARREAAVQETRDELVHRLVAENLRWALQKLAGMPVEPLQTLDMRSGTNHHPGFGDSLGQFPGGPSAWPAELEDQLTRAEQLVASYQAKLEALKQVKAAVEAFGGWEALAARLQEEAVKAVADDAD